MSNFHLVTTLVTKWDSVDRPFKAELRVDGYPVQESYHVTIIEAFIWAEETKKAKLKDLKR